MATYRTTFIVQGGGSFPVDMLRYDSCFPYTGSDVSSLLNDERQHVRSVKLCKVHDGKQPNLTPNRWRSFTWSIDLDSIITEKIS